MKDLKQIISSYSSKDLEQRKSWYSPAAEAYNKTRPGYPKDVIHRVVEVAQLSSNSKILEVGCGPATATVAFAQLGCSMVCLEPNPDFCQLAQQHCEPYSNVEIRNTSFEEWTLEAEKFDAVLAATAFHWIPPEVGYPKAADALGDNGYLILLWNTGLEPQDEVCQVLQEVYKVHAPTLVPYEGRKTYEDHLKGFGQIIRDSGRFKDLVFEQLVHQVTYNIDDYLMLLNTYSPYLELNPQIKDSLFERLRQKIERDFGGSIQLSYLSAFHIARKY